MTFETIHNDLDAEVPEFGAEIKEHLIDYDGEVLQHVLFGDLTRFTLSAHERGDSEIVDRLLAFLERACESTDPRVQNLVAASFVENVGVWEPAVSAFVRDWPPCLKEIARQQGWKP